MLSLLVPALLVAASPPASAPPVASLSAPAASADPASSASTSPDPASPAPVSTAPASPSLPDPADAPAPGKTRKAALAWSGFGTALPILAGWALLGSGSSAGHQIPGALLVGSGLILGPSLGQFYAGSYGHGAFAAGLRLLGTWLFIEGSDDAFHDCDPEYETCGDRGWWVAPGALLVAGGMAYSVIQVSRPLETRAGAKRGSLELEPILFPASHGAAGGVLARLRF